MTSYKEDKTHLGATVIPTQTRAFSATVRASVSTGHPASLATNLSLLLVVASSVTHSTIQREISLVSSVVTASPSVSRKTEKMSSQLSSTTTMTISTSPMIQQTVSGGIVSKFSSRPENELHKFTSSFKTDSFSRMSSSIVVSWSDYTSKYTTKVSVSISQNQTTNLPPDSTTSTTSNSEMSEASLAQKDFSVSTTFSPSHSIQMVNSSVDSSPSPYMSSTKASTKTQWLTKPVLKPTDWIPLSASQKFSALSTDSYHQTRISRSSHTHSSEVTSKLAESSASVSKSPSQIRSSTVSEDRIFLSSTVATLVDKSNTQSFSSVISTTSSRKEVTSEVIVSTLKSLLVCYDCNGGRGARVTAIVFGSLSPPSPTQRLRHKPSDKDML